MMDNHGKMGPQGGPVQDLDAKVRKATEDLKVAQGVSVMLIVSGGIHGEHYEFLFNASGKGVVECGFQCQMRDRDYPVREYDLPKDAFARILETVSVRDMVMAKSQDVPIPPDSLVGQLVISDGEHQIRSVFMADPGQAETAGYELRSNLAQTANMIYELAAQLTGAKDARP